MYVIPSITYQNLFRQFQQLAGMSGTAKVAENEFINTYNLPVKMIKTHKKVSEPSTTNQLHKFLRLN